MAGVAGAEGWLLDEKGLSLRASESSSAYVVAAESLRLLRSAEDATADAGPAATAAGALEAVALIEEVDATTVLVVAGEASVARARVKERALDGELGFVLLLRSTGIDETVQGRSEGQANRLKWAGLTS